MSYILSSKKGHSVSHHIKRIHVFYKNAISIALLGFSAQIQAETAPSSDENEMLFEMSLEALFNIDVSIASKNNQKLSTVPSIVTVFTRKELDQMGVAYLTELINFIPGFQATRESIVGEGAIVSGRGQSTPTASYNLLVMVDGQRLNADLSGGAFVENRYITLENAKQVEVIRGPGSALYGTSAFVGVINIITQTDKNSVQASVGSQKRKQFQVNASSTSGDNQFTVFARHYSDNGSSYGAPFTTTKTYAPEFVKDQKELSDLYFTYQYSDVFSMRYRRANSKLEGFLTADSDGRSGDFYDLSQESINVNYLLLNSPTWTVDMGASYSAFKQDTLISKTAANEQSLYFESDKTEESELKLYADFSYRLSENNTLIFGSSWRNPTIDMAKHYSSEQSPTNQLQFSRFIVPEDDRKILGIYIQDQHNFTDALSLTLGLRSDDYSDGSKTTNPRASLVWATNKNHTLKLMYGEAFRSPSIRQTSSFSVGNPDLLPETIKTTEFAWLYTTANLSFATTYFASSSAERISTVRRNGEAWTHFCQSRRLGYLGYRS